MSRTAFISISYINRNKLFQEINTINNVLRNLGFSPLIFVNKFFFLPTQEKKMMSRALKEIKKCDVLIAEVSEKPIGVGIEIGYAKALSKPIIYLKNYKSEYSTTVAGVSDFIITYNDVNHLKKQLQKVVKNLKNKLLKQT